MRAAFPRIKGTLGRTRKLQPFSRKELLKIKHKTAAFNSYINHLFNIPLSRKSFMGELAIIKQIALINNFDVSIVDTILTKINNRRTQSSVFIREHIAVTPDSAVYRSLTFIGPISYRISNLFRSYCRIAFRSSNSVELLFVNNKDKVDPPERRIEIYKLSCNSCNTTYVGRIIRNFKIRLKEHPRSLYPTSGFSHFAEHLLDNNHEFDGNLKILHFRSRGLVLNNLESLEILRESKNNNTVC